MKVTLIWDGKAIKARKKQIAEAQDYIDRECLRRMTPFVPVALPKYRNAGKLRDSGRVVSPGRIEYTAPYARDDYYAYKNHRRGGNKQAKRMWFDVMKKKEGKDILHEAGEILGVKPK